jgi:hypothetical protein
MSLVSESIFSRTEIRAYEAALTCHSEIVRLFDLN